MGMEMALLIHATGRALKSNSRQKSRARHPWRRAARGCGLPQGLTQLCLLHLGATHQLTSSASSEMLSDGSLSSLTFATQLYL